MSYEKAMKHWRNIRKCKKQQHQYFGFDCFPKNTPSAWSIPVFACTMNIKNWFSGRNSGDAEQRARIRSIIRDEIKDLRSFLASGKSNGG
jgi:hypothetical protein